MKDKPLSSSVVGTDLTSGKEVNKVDLCRRFSLDPKKPLFSFIGRLVVEKGADLLPGIVYKALLRKDISILILGEGKAEISAELSSLAVHFKSDLACITGFDEVLAHQIYAGSDFLLMPSRTEPCGFSGMMEGTGPSNLTHTETGPLIFYGMIYYGWCVQSGNLNQPLFCMR